MKKWEIISSKKVLDEPWFRARKDKVRLPNGKVVSDYFVWDADDICVVITVTEKGEFVLNKQYEHAAGKIIYGFVGGMIKKDESPRRAALREVTEETGYVPKKITLVGKIWQDPTKKTACCYVYLAEKAVLAKKQKLDMTEDIEISLVGYQEVIRLILAGKICDAAILAAFFLAEKKYPRICK